MKSISTEGLINFILLVLIATRFFGELMSYSWIGGLFALLYFVSFVWVFGESWGGYWWTIIVSLINVLILVLMKDLFWMILVVQILIMGLGIVSLIRRDFDEVRRKK